MFRYFLSQPHQPFFALAMFNAIVAMLIFMLNYKGVLTLGLESKVFHIYTLIFLFFSNFLHGFLLTTFPRFNQYKDISQKFYKTLFLSSVVASLLFYVGVFFSFYALVAAMGFVVLIELAVSMQLHTIYNKGAAVDKRDSYWILTAKYFGVLGSGVFLFVVLASYFQFGNGKDFSPLAIYLSFYLYLVFLAFSVAQRMVPFFSHIFVNISNKFLQAVFALFVLHTLFSIGQQQIVVMVIDTFLGVLLFVEFAKWKLPLTSSPAILWVLHLALFWLPTAFIISSFSAAAEVFLHISTFALSAHLFAIGFLTTILLGFGSRVILGHSGRALEADKLTIALFYLTQVVVLSRVAYSLSVALNWNLEWLFDVSAGLWLVLFMVWAGKYMPYLFKKAQ